MSGTKQNSNKKIQDDQLTEILDRISDAFVALDKNWCFTYMNNKASEIIGRDPEQMIGKNIWEEFPEITNIQFYELYGKAKVEKEYVSNAVFYPPLNKWFESHVYPSEEGTYIITKDITEKKNQEQKLGGLQFKMDAAIRIGKLGYWEWDIVKDEVFWSDRMYEIYDIEKGTALKYDSVISRVHPEDIQFHHDLVAKKLKDKDNSPFKYRVQWPDGTIRYVLVEMEVEDNDRGEAIKLLGTVMDITESKNAEEKLIQQEYQLRLFIDSSPVALLMLDKDMKYMDASKQWKQDYNIGNENLIRESHYKIFPEIPEHWKEIHQRCLEGETAKKEEELFVRADGTEEWIRWEVHPWYKASNEIGGIIIFSENITERKKSAELIAERENRLRTILETEPECVKQLNQKGEVMEMNPAGLAMIEAGSLDMVKGKSVLEIVNEPYKKAFSKLTKEVFNGKAGNLEFEITGLKGTRRWLETHAVPLKNNDGMILSLLGVTRDITERKTSETNLRKSLQRNTAFLNAIPDLIFIISNEGIITDFHNPKGTTTYVSPDRFLGKNLSELLPADLTSVSLLHVKKALEKKESPIHHYQLVYPPGLHSFEARYAGISETEVLVIVRDITQNKQAEEKILQMNQKLEQRVNERTAALEEANKELEEINELFLGREVRIMELKEEIKELKKVLQKL